MFCVQLGRSRVCRDYNTDNTKLSGAFSSAGVKDNRLGTIINKTFSIFYVLKVEIMQNHMLLSFLCKALKSREEERSCKCLMKSVLCIICEHTVFVLYLLSGQRCFYFQPPCIKDEATKMCISEEIAGAVVRCAATLNIAKTCYSFPPF